LKAAEPHQPSTHHITPFVWDPFYPVPNFDAMARALDMGLVCVCVAAVATILVGMLAHVQGGGKPALGWFTWHPILMVLSFSCLMPLGRLVYHAEASWLGEDKESRRSWHRIIMSLAVLAMLGGYLCIFMAHLPIRKFFGYDFNNKAWGEWARIAHSWIGYATILGSLAQASTGINKITYLNTTGQKVFTQHGTTGKLIMCFGALVVVLAVKFWGWSLSMKVAIAGLAVLAATWGVLLPSQQAAKESEEQPLRP